MIRRHRAPPQPRPSDLTALRRLVDRADLMSRKPQTEPASLTRAAQKAAKAVLPPGQQVRDSAFVKLIALSALWWRLAPDVRAARAPDLAPPAQPTKIHCRRSTARLRSG